MKYPQALELLQHYDKLRRVQSLATISKDFKAESAEEILKVQEQVLAAMVNSEKAAATPPTSIEGTAMNKDINNKLREVAGDALATYRDEPWYGDMNIRTMNMLLDTLTGDMAYELSNRLELIVDENKTQEA